MDIIVALELLILEGVRFIAGLVEILRAEVVHVRDDDAAALQIADARLERGGVHRHQNVHGVARGMDVPAREIDLEPAHSCEGSDRRAYLGGKVGERAQIVPGDGRRVREPVSGELHPVAGIAGEAYRHRFEFNKLLLSPVFT